MSSFLQLTNFILFQGCASPDPPHIKIIKDIKLTPIVIQKTFLHSNKVCCNNNCLQIVKISIFYPLFTSSCTKIMLVINPLTLGVKTPIKYGVKIAVIPATPPLMAITVPA